MNEKEIKEGLIEAAKKGTLMTPKHDPHEMTTVFNTYRSVIAHHLAVKIEAFLASNDYTINVYENLRRPNKPLYVEIIPNSGSTFTVPASGITASSQFASSTLDRIVAVSGRTQGWHIFGEDSQNIQQMLQNKDIQKLI